MTPDHPAIDCRAAIDHLYAYLDGELSDDVRGAVEAHLERCAGCFPQFQLERTFLRFLDARASAQRAPAAVRRRIFEAILLMPERPGHEEP